MTFRHGSVDSDNESNRNTRSRIYWETGKPRGKTFSMQPKIVYLIRGVSGFWLNVWLISDATRNELLMRCKIRWSWIFWGKFSIWIILCDSCCSFCAQLSSLILINVNISSLLLNRLRAISDPFPTTHAKISLHCFPEPVKKVSNTPIKLLLCHVVTFHA